MARDDWWPVQIRAAAEKRAKELGIRAPGGGAGGWLDG